MPLVPCPTCERQISSNAYICGGCGEPLKPIKAHFSKGQKICFVIAIATIIMFIPMIIKDLFNLFF